MSTVSGSGRHPPGFGLRCRTSAKTIRSRPNGGRTGRRSDDRNASRRHATARLSNLGASTETWPVHETALRGLRRGREARIAAVLAAGALVAVVIVGTLRYIDNFW